MARTAQQKARKNFGRDVAEGLVFVFSFDFETHNLGRMRNILEVVKKARGRLCT